MDALCRIVTNRRPQPTRMHGCITKVASLFIAGLCLGSMAVAQSIVGATVTGKDRNEYAVWFSGVSFCIQATTAGMARPPAPTFEIDLYDEDGITSDDGRDVDLTETSATVRVSQWRFRGPVGGGGARWDCLVTTGGAQESDVTDPLPFDWPDPRVEIKVWVGANPAVSVDLCAPGLPSVGEADFGIAGPSAIANVSQLAGERIAAFSRGFDDISLLPLPRWSPPTHRAALYFVCDHNAPMPASDPSSGPGRMFVLDAESELWPEDLYAARFDSNLAVLGTPRYLNLNTAAPGAQTATSEIYFVYEGTGHILYSPTGDPTAASLFLDLDAHRPVTALAVEDRAPRGVWGSGDRILYAEEGHASISALTYGLYGNRPVYLAHPGGVFDGSLSLDFGHFDRGATGQPNLPVGSIRALAVSFPGRAIPEPQDRQVPGVVDFNRLLTYGLADGGWVGFQNSPVLGVTDFRVTLRRARPGTWATLMIGVPIPWPGIALPHSVSRSRLLLDPAALIEYGALTATVYGATERQLPIPNVPRLAGVRLGFQWVVCAQPALPLKMSDAGVAWLR